MTLSYEQHRSGLYLPYKKRPTAIDFFSGCGGMSVGFIQAGFEVIAAIDWDVVAMITYMLNLGSYPVNVHFIEEADKKRMNDYLEKNLKKQVRKNGIIRFPVSGSGWISSQPDAPSVKNVWVGDIKKLKGTDILDVFNMMPGEVDCVMGGPPCQGFSMAGKRETMDPRNSLVFDYARLILEIQPKTFVMENVPGILTMVTPEGIPVIDAFCRILADGGFGTFEALKKSILASSGTGLAMKGCSNKKTAKQKTKNKKPEKEANGMSLF